ncbi:MAG: hypothetical protein ABEK03_01200 [Candidatus Bipolaricaulia bacterium]
MAFETRADEESDSGEVTISETFLQAVDIESHETTNLSSLIQSVMDRRDEPY